MDLAHAGNFGMNFGENLPEKKESRKQVSQ
jgi:hypothetical protein